MTDERITTYYFTQQTNATPPSSTSNYANTMTLNLPTPKELKNSKVALSSLFLYYSWPNVSIALNNNSFSYTFASSASLYAGTVYPVKTSSGGSLIADGIYQIADLNNALQYTMFTNGHYFVDNNGNNVFYLALAVNPATYSVNVTATPVTDSTALPTGWTNPAAWTTHNVVTNFGANLQVPQLIIPNTGNVAGSTVSGYSSISKIFGITPGSYPSAPPPTVKTQTNGQFPPQVTSTNSINVACNLVNEASVSPLASNIIYSFSPTVGSGQLVSLIVQNLLWLPVTRSQYAQVQIRFLTDSLFPLQVLDPAVSATLLVKEPTSTFGNANSIPVSLPPPPSYEESIAQAKRKRLE